MAGLLSEIGPCRVSNNGKELYPNPYSWNSAAHVLFLDQPTNSGFSYGESVTTSEKAAADVYAFLQAFYELYPKYKECKLHIFGESYAGHYIPVIATEIIKRNKHASRNFNIPLTSIGIGNGIYNLQFQYSYLGKMACGSTYPPTLTVQECLQMGEKYKEFSDSLFEFNTEKDIKKAANVTNNAFGIMDSYVKNGRNQYDVRKMCGNSLLCNPYIENVVKYLNQTDTKDEIGARRDIEYNVCSDRVNIDFVEAGDLLVDTSALIPHILYSNVTFLNYVGDADLICNWYGNKAWTLNMDWRGSLGFNMVPDKPWYVNGAVAGEVRSYDGLTFLRILNSGHMVPEDQPEAALAMLTQWINGKSF